MCLGTAYTKHSVCVTGWDYFKLFGYAERSLFVCFVFCYFFEKTCLLKYLLRYKTYSVAQWACLHFYFTVCPNTKCWVIVCV